MASIFRQAVAGLRWLLVGAVVAAVVAGAGIGVATIALGDEPHSGAVALDRPIGEWLLVADPGIDRQQAMDAAVAAVPGSTAVSAEFDTEDRAPVWEVEVVSPTGVEYEVTIDANTGDVLGAIDHD